MYRGFILSGHLGWFCGLLLQFNVTVGLCGFAPGQGMTALNCSLYSCYLMILTDPIRSWLSHTDPVWSWHSNTDPLWSCLSHTDPLWSCRLSHTDPVWSWLSHTDPVWSYALRYGCVPWMGTIAPPLPPAISIENRNSKVKNITFQNVKRKSRNFEKSFELRVNSIFWD